MNNTSTSPDDVSPLTGVCSFQDIVSKLDALLYITVALLAIVGNIIVFLCYYKYKPLRGVTNIYILSLSASDLLVALLSVPFSFAVFLCSMEQIDEGEVGDLVYNIFDMVPSILSIYALVLVAVDRAIAITKPFLHRKYMNNKRATYNVILVWVYVFLLVSFRFLLDKMPFTLFIIIMAYAVPVLVMIISYMLMGRVAKKHAKELSLLDRTKSRLRCSSISCGNGVVASAYSNNSSTTVPARKHLDDSYTTTTRKSLSTQADASSIPLVSSYQDLQKGSGIVNRDDKKSFRQSMRRFSTANLRTRSTSLVNGLKLLKRELKAAFTLSLILSCFILSWTPFIALNIQLYCCPTCHIEYNMVKYFKMMHYTNSALNPILYILLNKQWRNAFFVVICKKRRSRRASSNLSDTVNTVAGW